MQKILPVPTKASLPFWQACHAGILQLQRCNDCGTYVYYPGYMCPACASLSLTWTPVSGRGTVFSCTVIERPASPAYKDDVPMAVALVELAEGPVMMTNVVGVSPYEVRIGAAVQVRFQPVSDEITLPMFELVRDVG